VTRADAYCSRKLAEKARIQIPLKAGLQGTLASCWVEVGVN
jgi:hypothetical protein